MSQQKIARTFLEQVIRPTLAELSEGRPAINSAAAEQLLLGTGLAESGLLWPMQKGAGPALSVMQVEPSTALDLWDRRADTFRLERLIPPFYKGDMISALTWHPPLAVALARLKYWDDRHPLPVSGDWHAQAAYWKRVYNTPLGAGTEEGYLRKAQATLKAIWG